MIGSLTPGHWHPPPPRGVKLPDTSRYVITCCSVIVLPTAVDKDTLKPCHIQLQVTNIPGTSESCGSWMSIRKCLANSLTSPGIPSRVKGVAGPPVVWVFSLLLPPSLVIRVLPLLLVPLSVLLEALVPILLALLLSFVESLLLTA